MARRTAPKKDTNPLVYTGGSAVAFVDAEKLQQESFAATYSRRETLDSPTTTFPNIDAAALPFKTSNGNSYVDTREAIKLAVRAYWAYPLLRNVVEVMGELSNSNLYLKGGNKKTRDFVEAWMEKINLWQLKEQFFREWFRSGNWFVYRFDGDFTPSDIAKMTQVFGALDGKSIPIRYVTLNPETITTGNGIAFGKAKYFKVLSSYEIQRLKEPATPEEREIVKQLDAKSLKAIKDSGSGNLELDPDRLSTLLYKAQAYEPMGVPMAYGVLKDIEAKLELKRIDLSIARTTDRALLLITVGETPGQYHKGGNNINQNTIAALTAAFQNEGIARTLISDYTVKGSWLIPDINKILGPEKYIQIDKDIGTGLNAILFDTGEKFANTSIKVQIFVERLKEARNAFLKNFLQPEIRKVCQAINAKNYPTAYFEDLSLKDELQYSKLMLSMAQLGFLTPEELFEAMESGKLPVNDESLESQRKFKGLREEGLYMPIVGGSTEIQKQQLTLQDKQINNQYELGKEGNAVKAKQAASKVPVKSSGTKSAGRPSGAKAPKSSSSPSPIGTSKASTGYSIAKFHELAPTVSEVHNAVEKGLRKQWGVRKFSEEQVAMGKLLVASIISNEPQETWAEKVSEYLKEPKEIATAAQAELDDIQIKHDVDIYLASILRLAATTAPEDNE